MTLRSGGKLLVPHQRRKSARVIESTMITDSPGNIQTSSVITGAPSGTMSTPQTMSACWQPLRLKAIVPLLDISHQLARATLHLLVEGAGMTSVISNSG